MAPILKPGTIIGGHYEVIGQLKHYKELFRCRKLDDTQELVLKLEKIDDNGSNRLEDEWHFYRKLSPTKCFEIAIDYHRDDNYRYLLMRHLGPNLYEFWKRKLKDNDWHLETVVTLADEMVSRVANCHIRSVIHRDIKPENFVVDANDNRNLYLIDFNLAKLYSSATEAHIPYRIRSPKFSIGNVQFLSINAHKGEEQSRRDDLISVCYTLIFLAKGSLPWSHLSSKHFESRVQYLEAVGKRKTDCSLDELCDTLPVQFKECITYCLGLGFAEKPNYFKLRQLFASLSNQLKNSKDEVVYVKYQPKPSENLNQVKSKCRQNLSEMLKQYVNSSPPSML